jgi:hypothetical protein
MQKIYCDTITIYRNKITGKKYKTKKDFLRECKEEDLATDIEVHVPNLDLFGNTNES